MSFCLDLTRAEMPSQELQNSSCRVLRPDKKTLQKPNLEDMTVSKINSALFYDKSGRILAMYGD